MQLPAPLLRKKHNVHKNDFGHVLILAGSARMLGAAALTSLAAMRSGAGLVSVGVPASLNKPLQRKISSVVMTIPLPETTKQTISLKAFTEIKKTWEKFSAIVIGPGLSPHPSTQKLILRVIKESPIPLVIDADALNALSGHLDWLKKSKTAKVLTPHPGEMSRLIKMSREKIEGQRTFVAKRFADQYGCVLVLKGHHTVVAAPKHRVYINKTGNAGMATAGTGDVLSGMIGAFLAQGIESFEGAKTAVYLHGKAGDLAAKQKTKAAMIATDIVDQIPRVLKQVSP